MLEMVSVTYDGAHAAERALSDLRAERDDAWLSEVSIIEHHNDGRYSVKAKNPDVEETHAGSGAAIGGLTGLFIGAIGGPFGLLLWSGVGALAGASIGEGRESAFLPMVAELKAALPPGASSLILVGEKATLDGFVKTVEVPESQTLRRPLTSEQARELSESSSR